MYLIRPRMLFFALFACLVSVVIWQNSSLILHSIVNAQLYFHQMLSGHIRHFNERPYYYGALLAAASLAYGVFHAVGPGHGKAVLVTYLTTQNESIRQGIKISFAAAFMQSLMAIVVVTVVSVLLEQTFKVTQQTGMQAEQISYVMVILFGGYLFVKSLLKLRSKKQPANDHHHHSDHHHSDHHGHGHGHDHEHHGHEHPHQPHNNAPWHADHAHTHSHEGSCGCQHSYVPEQPTSLWQSVLVVLSMGIRPCSGAIVVLMYANLVDLYWIGTAATLLMGLGTGLSISAIGFLALYCRERLVRFASTAEDRAHFHLGPKWRLLGSTLLISLGWGLLVTTIEMGHSHPLL